MIAFGSRVSFGCRCRREASLSARIAEASVRRSAAPTATANGTLDQRVGVTIADDAFVNVSGSSGVSVHLKLEGLNPAGSIKLKTALGLLESVERCGALRPGCRIVESTSGNLGLALSMLCGLLGVEFVCVCDPNTPVETRDIIARQGGKIELVDRLDSNGGFLGKRLERIHELLDQDEHTIWTDQYSNPSSKLVHHRWTAPAIVRRFADLAYLFVGVGTSGTAMGCAEYLRAHAPRVRIIGVDSVGSVSFGGPPGRRYLPGLGMSQPPPLLDLRLFDDALVVPEAEAVRACWAFRKRHGFAVGPSTGTVLAGIEAYSRSIEPGAVVVGISPDLGDRYRNSLYDRDWIGKRFPGLEQELG